MTEVPPTPPGAPPTASVPGQPGPVPGAGTPLVPGPPGSVRQGISATAVNRSFGIGAVVAILALIVVVILVGLLIVNLLTHH